MNTYLIKLRIFYNNIILILYYIMATTQQQLEDRYIKLPENIKKLDTEGARLLTQAWVMDVTRFFYKDTPNPNQQERAGIDEKIRNFFIATDTLRKDYEKNKAEAEAKRVRESAMFADDEIENNWINKPIVEVGNFKDIENALLQKITNDDYINNRHNYVSFNISERKSPDGDNYQWYNNDTNKPLPGYDSLLGNTKKRKIEMNNLLTNYTFSDIDDAEVALNSLKEEARINNSNEYDKDIENIKNYIKQQSRNPGRP